MESKAKDIMAKAKNRVEAQKLMQKEGFSTDESARIIQRYYRTQKSKNNRENHKKKKEAAPQPPKQLSQKDQQVDLMAFSQNVHLLNQEIHKNLRQNKTGIPLDSIQKLPSDYKRPPGFLLIPGLLGTVPGGDYKYNSSRSSDCDHELAKELIQR